MTIIVRVRKYKGPNEAKMCGVEDVLNVLRKERL